MEWKKITSDAEYAKALSRMERLMFRVLPFTEEGDELERLSKLIEEYENENYLYVDTAKQKDDETPLAADTLSDFLAKKKKQRPE